MAGRGRVGNRGWRSSLVALLAGAAAWELAGRLLRFSFLPPFSTVVGASWELIQSQAILGHLSVSLVSLAIGFVPAVALGLTLGALMGRFRHIEYLFDPYLYALLATPNLIFVPILFALFGVGRGTQAAIVFLYAFSVIVSNTMAGVRASESGLMEMARSFGANKWQAFLSIVVPGALPLVMAGLRLGTARAVKGMINGEMFIALMGLGALIRTYGGRFEADKVLGVLLVVNAVGVASVGLLQALDRRLMRWAD